LTQFVNVAAQFPSAHLFRGLHFSREVGRLLRDLFERSDGERRVFDDAISRQVSHPAVLQDPAFDVWLPESAVRVNAARDLKRLGIEFEDREICKQRAVRIEEAIIKNSTGFPENPL